MKKSTSKEAKPVAPAKSVAPVASKSAAAGKPVAQSKVTAAEPKAIKATSSKVTASKAAVTDTKVAKPVIVAEAKPAAPAKAKAPAAKVPAVKASAAPAVKAAAVETLPTTILIAQVDVGFGNTLVVRGEGGGLSWDKGVAMENIDATQWKLVLPSTTTPVVFKFLVNDERWSLGDDYVAVPGSTSALVPLF